MIGLQNEILKGDARRPFSFLTAGTGGERFIPEKKHYSVLSKPL
jgi:hypothetical protein